MNEDEAQLPPGVTDPFAAAVLAGQMLGRAGRDQGWNEKNVSSSLMTMVVIHSALCRPDVSDEQLLDEFKRTLSVTHHSRAIMQGKSNHAH